MNFKFCPFCGQGLAAAFKFCPYCGENLAQFAKATTEEKSIADNMPEGSVTIDTEPDCTEEASREKGVESLSTSLNYLENEAVKKCEFNKKLERARVLCIRGDLEGAKALYDEFVEEYPAEPEGYIGYVRVASKNFTVLSGDEIDEAIALLFAIVPQMSDTRDNGEYADYLARRALRDCVVENGILTKYNGTDESLVIPSGYVKEIKDAAFKGNKVLTSVTIFSGIKSVGSSAFEGCENLRRLTVGAESIEKRAFYGCEQLESITIEDGVTRIGDEAFKYAGLGRIRYPINAPRIGLFIPESVKSIGYLAFEASGFNFYCASTQEKAKFWGMNYSFTPTKYDWGVSGYSVKWEASREDAN